VSDIVGFSFSCRFASMLWWFDVQLERVKERATALGERRSWGIRAALSEGYISLVPCAEGPFGWVVVLGVRVSSRTQA
jgi:hypothetical protein